MTVNEPSIKERLEKLRNQLASLELPTRRDPLPAPHDIGFGNFQNWDQWNDWRNWNNPPQPGR